MRVWNLLILLIVLLPIQTLAEAPQTECDRVAAHSSDTQRAAAGVEQENFDIPAARAACAEAVSQYPDEDRFQYQYGQSFFYDGDYAAALPYFTRAAELGSAQGQLVLGLVLMGGYVDDPDVCTAGRWWLAGARQNHLYSKVYLLQNWVDGLFEDCGLDLTESEASDMVRRAEALAVTREQLDDIAQLKDNWDAR